MAVVNCVRITGPSAVDAPATPVDEAASSREASMAIVLCMTMDGPQVRMNSSKHNPAGGVCDAFLRQEAEAL